jgi:uncharacterized UBP type Zn finger protein
MSRGASIWCTRQLETLFMSRTSQPVPCTHLAALQEVPPTSTVCDQCVVLGDQWVHLRACLSCGQVGCCDNSKNKHATKHHNATGHPLVRSIEHGEQWIWCYVDKVVLTPE